MSRVRSVKQPRGGYINPKSLDRIAFDDGMTLYDESISPTTMGMVVDYLTRFDQGSPASEAFRISLKGAALCNREKEAEAYLSGIRGLDDDSVLNACRLVWFDQVYRTGTRGFGDPADAIPDHETCENVRTMVKRASEFFKRYGPVVHDCRRSPEDARTPYPPETGISPPRTPYGTSKSRRTSPLPRTRSG